MGIYDRSYYREEVPALQPWDKYSMVTNLIIINAALLVLNFLFTNRDNAISEFLLLRATDLNEPWNWYRFLTYGFVHGDVMHLLLNMISLYFLGQAVEARYGRWEFLRFYLLTIIISGVVYGLLRLIPGFPGGRVLGASGAVVGVSMLYVYNYPQATIMFAGVIPMKAWLLGILTVVGNLTGTSRYVAYDVHLVGIACATAYYYLNINLGFMENASDSLRGMFKRKPKLRVHREEDDDPLPTRDEAEADRLLEKIHREGQSSLTSKEQKFLEKYSRRVREKRNRT